MSRWSPLPVVLAAFALASGLPALGRAADAPGWRLEKPRAGQLLSVALTVDAPVEVSLDAVGCVPKLSDEYLATAWLLDAATRRAVWSLDASERELATDNRYLRRASDRVRLAPGQYALYLFGGSQWSMEAPFRRMSNVLNDIADLISRENPGQDPQPYLDQCYVSLAPVPGAPTGALHALDLPAGATAPGAATAGALLDLTRAPADTVLSGAFRLARPAALRVRAYAEASRDTSRVHDWAWIEDAATGRPAWMMRTDQTRPAGGSGKNRIFDGEVRLPAGDYVARFVSDDSHAWGAWNATPPPDPDAWGLALFAGTGFVPADFQPLAPDAVRRPPGLLASLTLARNRDDRRQEFTLARPTKLHVEALLEGVGGDMADRAWIAEAATGRKVWILEYDATQPAGGSGKNRRFAGDVDLPAGHYAARVRCDDSHAFGAWNADPPPEPWKWGMVVTVAKP